VQFFYICCRILGQIGANLGANPYFEARGKMTNVDLQALKQTHFGENS
jgi:hypothetical protein